MFWIIFAVVTGIKLLFMPAYRSTDFEVHRNWLAITHSLPLSKWYYEDTSEWTLDYPPFFAYFEYALSHIAKFFDREMLKVENLNYASDATVLFQRLSVIVADVVFAFGVKQCIQALGITRTLDRHIIAALLLGNAGLLFVDHIHFQYNGFLMGILLLSIAKMIKKEYISSAVLFCVLLNLKHIFMYIAPAYTIFLFRHYCLGGNKFFQNLVKLGAIVILSLLASFGPFYEHIPQVLSRLFPFKRGLTHAYWAPNFWALYNFADKLLSILLKKSKGEASFTSGLAQEYNHEVLPAVTPVATFVITAFFMSFCAYKLFFKIDERNSGKHFIKAVVLFSCTSFLFGWHVHEKAILMVLIPLCLISGTDVFEAKMSIFLGVVAHYSLFPLLYKRNLLFVKIFLHLTHTFLSMLGLKLLFWRFYFSLVEKLYLCGLVGLFVYENVLQQLIGFDVKLPFLPLMLTSVYCSLGVIYFYTIYYYKFLSTKIIVNTKKQKVKSN